MTPSGGQWIRVRFAGGGQRLDWVPDEQPPSPDGTTGRWHVVPDPAGGDSRWEWHTRSGAPAVPAGEPAGGSMFKLPSMVPAPQPVPGPQPVAAVSSPPTSEADASLTQPLPLQAVPNRRPAAIAPSVFPTAGGPRQAKPPVRIRWAAWSLSVVLAVPVFFLLTRNSDNGDPAATAAQTELNPNADADQSVTGTPVTGTTPGTTTSTTTPGTTTPGTTTGGTNAAMASYLAHLYNLDATQGYAFASLGDDSLVSTGNAACGALDRGVTYDNVRLSVMSQIPNGGQVVLAAAATYLCPQNHSKLQEYTAKQQAGDPSGDVAAG